MKGLILLLLCAALGSGVIALNYSPPRSNRALADARLVEMKSALKNRSEAKVLSDRSSITGIHPSAYRGPVRPVVRAAASAPALSAIVSQEASGFFFTPEQVFPISTNLAQSVAVGDVNGDGLDDVVLATVRWFSSEDSCKVFIYLQQPDGSLAQPIKHSYFPGCLASSVWISRAGLLLADIDGDHIQDILVAYGDVAVARSGQGSNFEFEALAMPSKTYALAALDLDRDGALDIVAHAVSYGMYLLYNDQNGDFRKIDFIDSWETAVSDMKVGDVTGDGLPDLVLTPGQLAADFYVYPHDGVSGFGHVYVHESAESSQLKAAVSAVGDFNGDGLEDVALAFQSNDPAHIKLYAQRPEGGFDPSLVMESSHSVSASLTVDLNRDGFDDLVTLYDGGNAMGYYLGTGGGLSPQVVIETSASGYASGSVAAGDLDSDGCMDLAVARRDKGLVVIHGSGCGQRPHHLSSPDPARLAR